MCLALAPACGDGRDFGRERVGGGPLSTSAASVDDGLSTWPNQSSQPTESTAAPSVAASSTTSPPDASSTESTPPVSGTFEDHAPLCGNGSVEVGEECDDGAANDDSRPDACRKNCLTARCGDDVEDSNEACDGPPGCSFDCKVVECGNGSVEEGEECDPPATNVCTSTCRRVACGNGSIDEGEECEPPSAGRCNAECLLGVCGDGDVGPGEECDPPSSGTCDSTCRNIVCGDGIVSESEGCEPPQTNGCDAECRSLGCGNGNVDPGEECDPPGVGSCDTLCHSVACGNQRVESDEECDPPVSGSCDSTCKTVRCGNSRIDTGETCDPPAAGQCNTSCQTIRCGDGRVDPGETCEPQGSSDASCNTQCEATSTVGALTLYTFDSGIDPWQLYATDPSGLSANTYLSYDAQNGDVSPGVLRVEAPFTGSNQKVEFQVTFAQPIDMSGRVLRARVRLGSGLSNDAAHPGGIKFFAKAGANFNYASGEWTYLSSSGWQDISLVADAPILVPTEFDGSQVRQIGFELRTFSDTTQVSKAVIYVDSITY